MKRIFFAFALLVTTVSFAATPNVDEQVSKQFKETFPAALDIKWFEYESFYEVVFKNNDILCRVKYDLKGNIISTRRDYTEKDLSLFIVAKIKEKYQGKKIFGVTEITSSEGVTYNIVLEDDKYWTNINSDESGNISKLQKLKKA
jgi:hypothetical protein